MPAVTAPAHKKGDFFVDYEEKVFEDVKAKPGEKALITFHTVAFEGSIGLVNMLQGKRLQRKGFETSILLYGPGVTLGIQRGFPTIGDEAFPGHQNFTNQLTAFMAEGGKVYACRFALQALYGHGEPSLIPGIRPINPLDVLDLILIHRNDNAFMIHTWTVLGRPCPRASSRSRLPSSRRCWAAARAPPPRFARRSPPPRAPARS